MKTALLVTAIMIMGFAVMTLGPALFLSTLVCEWAEKKPLAPYCKVVAVGIDQMLGAVIVAEHELKYVPSQKDKT